MLSFKFESGSPDFSDSNDGELLRDIEEISKALYVDDKAQENSIVSYSNYGPKLAKKSHFGKGYEGLKEEQKNSSIWGWKPFKALSNMRRRKFTCYFFCHIHCIENLMLDLNDISIRVNWKRKDSVLRTLPSRVSNGVVEFEETLMSKCTVYGSRNGPRDFVKYEPKHFLLYASIVGAEGVEIGKHWVDLTRLLPLTLEELEQDKCSGKWSTSYKLAGDAEGATLHVSFGFLVTKNGLAEAVSSMKSPLALTLEQSRVSRMSFADSNSVKGNSSLRRAGSVPSSLSNASCYSSHCVDAKFELPKDMYDFSNSITMLYGKLEEAKIDSPAKFDLVSEHLKSPQLVANSLTDSEQDLTEEKHDVAEFTVTEKGVESDELTVTEKRVESECSSKEVEKLNGSITEDLELSSIEIIDAAEIFKGDEIYSAEEIEIDKVDEGFDCVPNDAPIDESNVPDIIESNLEKEVLDLNEISISQTDDCDELELSEGKRFVENKFKHKKSNLVKSLSFDNYANSVAEDFCNMLQDLRSPSPRDHVNLESPRERLLRQFEEDMMTSGNLFLDVDGEDDNSEYDFATASVSSSDYYVESVDFSDESVGQSSGNKLKARSLERLETQTLMQRWGLDEEAFQSSPYYSNGGFGSPISVPPEEPIALPSLAEGLGPYLQLKDGGYLRSMSPLLFRNAKNCGSLIMQTSKIFVLPTELGADVMDILQCLASVGSERLSKKVRTLMPLEDLSGKIMQQLAWEGLCEAEVHKRPTYSQLEPNFKIEVERQTYVQGHTYCSSSSTGSDISSEYVAAKDLALLALDSMEGLMIEGLKIQSGTPDHGAPSRINVRGSADDAIKLLDLSISLDEWLRAHENTQNASGKSALLEENLTLTIMMQLRDPLRNYEPVGGPMLGLLRVKRLVKPLTETSEDDEGQAVFSRFRLDEVHVAGLNMESDKLESWSPKRQQQSGSRWLVASGLTKNGNSRFSKSRSIMRMPTQVLKKPWARSFLWSISHSKVEVGVDPLNPLTRNPDVLFPQVPV